MIDASGNMELYDEELGRETYRVGIHTLPALEVQAGGPAEMVAVVRQAVAEVLGCGKIPVVLGGEHSISVGAVRAVQERVSSLSVLHLDAHADMRDSYQGTALSHACAGRRISEICPLVQVGIRSMSAEEALYLKTSSVATYAADFVNADVQWEDTVCGNLSGEVYITLDLDVLDPSVMPATGTPEPGGLLWKELLSLLRTVARRCRIRGFDVVELSPVPGLIAPDFLAAKLVYRMMGYIAESGKL